MHKVAAWTTLDFMKPEKTNKTNKKKKQANIKYDDYSGLTVEMQFLKAFK